MTDNPVYRAALEAAAVIPAMVAPGHWLVSDVNRVHDAILALPAPNLRDTLAAMVRPLEWRGDSNIIESADDGFGGTYSVSGNHWWHSSTSFPWRVMEASSEAAKAAAQVDYIRRILAALGMTE